MPTKLSDSANQVMALLNNARKMAVLRQNRRMAADVLHACALYTKSMRFPCDPGIFERLAVSIIDKNNYALLDAFANAERQFSEAMHEVEKKMTWRAIKLPSR